MKLVILFRHVERKVGRVHDKDQCTTVGIVTLALGKVELVPVGRGRFDELLGMFGLDASGKTNDIPVFAAPIAKLIGTVAFLGKQVAVFDGKFGKDACRNLDADNLRVAQVAVIRNLTRIVIADLTLVAQRLASGVAGPGREFGIRSLQDALFRFDEFVLDMPTAEK